MNRRTLDVGIPMLYAIAIVTTTFVGSGKAVGAVAAIGAMLVGLYYAAIRQNIKQ